jgi:menaquinone-specific isochorismate synthase
VTVGAEAAPSAELLKTEPTGIDPELVFESGSLTREGYLAAVENARRRISLGPLQKVVVARDLRGRLPLGADLRAPLSELALGYPDCWTFAVDGLIGSSPETLVRVDRGEVSARVLAGSMARGADAERDEEAALALATSSKDQDEHRFALMSVMAALAPYSSDLAASDLPFALKLPNLWHLASDVHGDLDGHAGALDLIGALHPTAAVAGFPTALALATIAELEPFDRGRYAGPVGWVGADGDGEWAVALRCAQLERGGALTAYAGAGIVAASRADRELAETTLKFRPITEAFGLSP